MVRRGDIRKLELSSSYALKQTFASKEWPEILLSKGHLRLMA